MRGRPSAFAEIYSGTKPSEGGISKGDVKYAYFLGVFLLSLYIPHIVKRSTREMTTTRKRSLKLTHIILKKNKQLILTMMNDLKPPKRTIRTDRMRPTGITRKSRVQRKIRSSL